MLRGWKRLSCRKRRKVEDGASCTSDEELDSDYSDSGEEGPTIVTVDDGKGGIKHIKVDKPVDSQSEILRSHSDGLSVATSDGDSSPRPGLGDLLRKEMKGKSFLNFEPQSEKLRKRIVSKRGNINIGKTRVSKRRRKFLSDFFNTMLDIKWRYVHLIFFIAFLGSWFLFALVWWVIIYYHGDLETNHLPDSQLVKDGDWIPCVWNIHNFSSVFLFSLETQHTIGYGGRMTSEECPEAIFIMSFQSIVGVMIQACMVGIIFSKLSRPKKRASTLMFSRNAVVCQRDGTNCLLFRVGNMRHSTLVEAHVRAILISKRVTDEGEIMPYFQTELKVGTDSEGEEDEIFFIWPTTLVHKIDEDSPFYSMGAKDFLKKRYEIVVILEGVIEQTGNSIQARSSYLPNEVLWGYRFVNLLNFKHSASEYKIDYSAFNAIYKTDMSTRSQKSKDENTDEEDIKCSVTSIMSSAQNHMPYNNPNHISSPQIPYLTHTKSPILPTKVNHHLPNNLPYPVVRDLNKSKSCVEILHMV